LPANDAKQNRLVGGWLRILLGIIQMVLAAAAVIVWLVSGRRPLAWWLAGAAVFVTLISRLLYRQ
jgi:hypothetical protein